MRQIFIWQRLLWWRIIEYVSWCLLLVLTDFKKKNLLILASVALLTFPSMIVNYRIDVEWKIESIPYSPQMFFYSLYDNIINGDIAYIAAIPSMLVVIMVLLTVVSTFCNFKCERGMVLFMIISCICSFMFEMYLKISFGSPIMITYTYIVAIILSIAYLILDGRKKERNKETTFNVIITTL